MRVLAVDYGERRTGLAVSDELGISAHGLDTIVVADEAEILARVVQVVKEIGAKKIVVGLPLNMDGTESEKSKKVREFAGILSQETSVPVVFWDERLTSIQAQRVMNEIEVKTYKNKPMIDRISATLILQEFMKTLS
ncbi:Holliday junction resolvase RuvX [Candidatus Latescibacterota bacterium]